MYSRTPLIDKLGNLWNGDIFSDHLRYRCGFGDQGRLPGHSINLTLSGAARFGPPSGPNFIAHAGDLVVVEPRLHHQWHVVPDAHGEARPWDVVFCGFVPRPAWTPWLKHPHVIPGYARVHLSDREVVSQVRDAMLKMVHFSQSSLPNRTEFAMNTLEQVLLWVQAFVTRRSDPLDPRIRKAVDYLSFHLDERITLATLARRANLSRARLAALFHQQVGDSPIRFLEMCRLLRAKELLRLTDQKLEAIAAAVGFCDAKYLSNRFRRRMGMSPSQYRARPN